MNTTPPPAILSSYICVSSRTFHAIEAYAAMKGVQPSHVAESWLNERISADAQLQWLAREFPKRMRDLDADFAKRCAEPQEVLP